PARRLPRRPEGLQLARRGARAEGLVPADRHGPRAVHLPRVPAAADEELGPARGVDSRRRDEGEPPSVVPPLRARDRPRGACGRAAGGARGRGAAREEDRRRGRTDRVRILWALSNWKRTGPVEPSLDLAAALARRGHE